MTDAQAETERLRSALKLIHTWAGYRNDANQRAFVLNRIAAICAKALGYSEESEEEDQK